MDDDRRYSRGRLKYHSSPREIYKIILTSPNEHIYINYPFGDPENPIHMKIKLFTAKGSKSEFYDLGFRVLKKWTISFLVPIFM